MFANFKFWLRHSVFFIENTGLLIGCGIRLHLHYGGRELSVLPQHVLAALCLRNSVAVCGGTLPDYEKFVVYFVDRYTKYCFISVLYILVLIWFSTVSRNLTLLFLQ
jgi:hypothetical protein